MRTEDAIEKMAAMAPIAAEAMNKLQKDQAFIDFIKNGKKGMANRIFMLNIIPILIRNCKDELIKCLAIFSDKTEDEVRNQNLQTTIKEIKAMIADEDMAYFFQSLRENEVEKTTKQQN